MRLLFPFILLLTVFSLHTKLWAQPLPVKFGDVKLNDLKMETYDADPDAAAIILADIGTVNFELTRGYLEFKRHKRIKILKKAGFDWAEFSIQYSQDGEKLTAIKGITYTLSGGKLEKHKLDKKTIIKEEVNEFFSQKKISMPAIQEGAIIELEYTLISENFTIPNWYFQTSEPTLYSEYRVKAPQFFDYARYYQGAVKLDVNTTETYSNTESRPNGKMWNYSGKYYRQVAKNVPALREEPFMTTPNDYRAKAGYQLQAIDIPGQLLRMFMEDWNKVAENLWLNEHFGLSLKDYNNASVKKVVPSIVANADNEKEKMIAIYDYVRKNMEWNGEYSFSTSQSLNNIFDEKTGWSSDINLMLTLMLREAGISALPAILSTRSHGKMQPIYPFLDQFNHVIAYAKIGEEEFWLDAIHKNRPYNLLASNDLNQTVLLVQRDNPQWKPLNPKQKYYRVINAHFTLSEEGHMEGTIDCSDKEYSAFYKRMALNQEKEETYAQNQFKDDITDMELKSYSFENKTKLTEPLKSHYELSIQSEASVIDGRIYLNPMLNEDLTENPFKLEKRTFPVNYGYPYSETYIMTLELPKGYEIEELPEATRIGLPNKGGSFMPLFRCKG